MKFSKTAPVKILLLGAGGTGGYVIPHLYRLAFTCNREIRVIVCDGDTVENKNLIRQNFIAQDIGSNKAEVLARRYAAAFGISCEYIPEFIESKKMLMQLTTPNSPHGCWDRTCESQRIILIGCVDNNRSRRLCHEVFLAQRDLIYIDSGNGESTGQVVCGVRQNGRTTYRPVCSLHNELLQKDDKFPSELSCAERSVSAPQSVTANLTAATAVTSFLYNLLVVGELRTRYITFSSQLITVRAETVKKRKSKSKAMDVVAATSEERCC